MRRKKSLMERFKSKVKNGGPLECWPWQAAIHRNGYGKIGSGKRSGNTLSAHRVAYEIAYGEIPSGMHVLHKCDNRKCCNPAHLFLGTNRDNMNDRNSKGRVLRGEALPQAKLTEHKIRLIRKSPLSHAKLALKYGVTGPAIIKIRNRERWAHVI